jgi:ketosteroid isomerase-like protein
VSHENVQATKRVIERFNRRDFAAWEDEFTPDYEFYPRLMGAIEGQSFQGRGGLERYFEIMDNLFDVWLVVAEEVREVGDSVLVRVRIESRGKGGEVPFEGWQSIVVDFRDAKVCKVQSFLTEDEALKAVADRGRLA